VHEDTLGDFIKVADGITARGLLWKGRNVELQVTIIKRSQRKEERRKGGEPG
jgi:hypothetical protein